MPKLLPIYWDFLGLHSPCSGIYTHMTQLSRSLEALDLEPKVIGEESRLYRACLKLPLSKITCPHLSSVMFKPQLAQRNRVIFHSFANINTDFLFQKENRIRTVLTVHDIIPLIAKGKSSFLSTLQFKLALGSSLKKSDKVLCVSQWTKQGLEEKFPQFADKYQVVPNGYQKKDFSLSGVKSKNIESQSFKILCVSRYEKYKRFDLCLEILASDSRYKMVFITDPRGLFFLTKKAQKLGLLNRLEILSNVSFKELETKYKETDVFLQTSLFEGYCLPAVDAMRFFKPIVYQKGHALEEVAGTRFSISLSKDACVEDWSSSIKEAIKMRSKESFYFGLEEALKKLPSWGEVAQKLKNIYLDLLG